MIRALSAKTKLGFVEGTIKKPAKEEPKYSPWFAATICYCHWFLNSASNHCIKHHFHRLCWGYVENLRDFLNETDHEFSKSGRWSIMTQYNSLVSEYYTKLEGLLDEIIYLQASSRLFVRLFKILLEYQQQEQILQLNLLLISWDTSWSWIQCHH